VHVDYRSSHVFAVLHPDAVPLVQSAIDRGVFRKGMFAAFATRLEQYQIKFDTTRTPKGSLLVGFTESRGLTEQEYSKLVLRRAEEQMERLRSQISRRPVGFRIMNLVFQAIDDRLEYLQSLEKPIYTPRSVGDAAGNGRKEPAESPASNLATAGDSSQVSDAQVSATSSHEGQLDNTPEVSQGDSPTTPPHRPSSSSQSNHEAMDLDSASAPEPEAGKQLTAADGESQQSKKPRVETTEQEDPSPQA